MPTTQRDSKGSPLTWAEMDANWDILDNHIADTSDAHDASAISVDSTTLTGTGTDVQAVLEELDNTIDDHIADASDAHDASAISVLDTVGAFTGTDVEAVLDEVADRIGATGAASIGFRNRLINGDMQIDQRNAGAAVAATSGGTTYAADRWHAYEDTDGSYTTTAMVSTSPPEGHAYYLRVTITSADASLAAGQFALMQQKIEGLNVSDLDWGLSTAKTITLSFKVRSSITGTFSGSLMNSAANRSYPFTYTISSANTWETKTITIAGDTTGTWLKTNGIGIKLTLSFGVGSTYLGTAGAWAAGNYFGATGETPLIGTNGATWDITGVQLEVGSVRTPFEQRPYGLEERLCQRYYQEYANSNIVGARGYHGAGGLDQRGHYFPVPMRTAPTAAVGGTWSVSNCSQPTVTQVTAYGYFISVTVTALGEFYYVCNGADDKLTFNAEL